MTLVDYLVIITIAATALVWACFGLTDRLKACEDRAAARQMRDEAAQREAALIQAMKDAEMLARGKG